ncbi:sodium channel regulatory subunit beta-2-like [Salvelinus sp. IW2-2015]|uniref:sodium channel regulatory subunit beta-2-like n=1 Tax=Salvelinus sp. IW2-2015 TaxID=2691554 RepID=UPI000CDF7363|nr:sodium channel subunit beta-2-like [Salvelinus alpinus]
MHFTLQKRNKTWMPAINLSIVGLMVYIMACPASSMDVLVHNQINVLNGTMVRIQCIFTSCYKMDVNKFAMNWTYQENTNETEEMFMTYKKGMMPLRTDQFSDRVQFVGNLEKNDLSITLSDVGKAGRRRGTGAWQGARSGEGARQGSKKWRRGKAGSKKWDRGQGRE